MLDARQRSDQRFSPGRRWDLPDTLLGRRLGRSDRADRLRRGRSASTAPLATARNHGAQTGNFFLDQHFTAKIDRIKGIAAQRVCSRFVTCSSVTSVGFDEGMVELRESRQSPGWLKTDAMRQTLGLRRTAAGGW